MTNLNNFGVKQRVKRANPRPPLGPIVPIVPRAPRRPRRTRTTIQRIHSLPPGLRLEIINQYQQLTDNQCRISLERILEIFSPFYQPLAPHIGDINTFRLFFIDRTNMDREYMRNLNTLMTSINFILASPRCMLTVLTDLAFAHNIRYNAAVQQFQAGVLPRTPERFLYEIFRQFRQHNIDVQNGVGGANGFGVRIKRRKRVKRKGRSPRLHNRLNMLPNTGAQIIGRNLLRDAQTRPCTELLRQMVQIFRNINNEYCPTEVVFNSYYGPRRNNFDYNRLMDILRQIVMSEMCITILRSFPRFRNAWDHHQNVHGPGSLRRLLWHLYQEFGPHQPHAWEQAFDDAF